MNASFRFRLVLVSALVHVPVIAQVAEVPPPKVESSPPEVTVPLFPNTTCPIMGKPISTRLFTDTDYGRIYICCKACIRDIHADPELAHATAYPTRKASRNATCPVSGRTIEAGATKLVLQGREFSVCSEGCMPRARANAQVVLAKLDDPTLVDVGNETCPLTAEPVADNAFCIVKGHLLRLASPKLVEEVKKDPEAVLERARQIARRAAGKDEQEPRREDGSEQRDA